MTKYKYSRKEIAKMYFLYISKVNNLQKDLLATTTKSSKECKHPKENYCYSSSESNPTNPNIICGLCGEDIKPKSSKEKEFIPQNGEEFWFKKKSPTPSTNIKEIEKIKHTEFTTTKIDECIDNLSVLVCNLGDKVNEIIDVINSLNTIIKK
jgi:hypothetical protein